MEEEEVVRGLTPKRKERRYRMMVRQRHGAESISVEEEDAPNKVLCVESTAMTEKTASKFFSTPKTGWFTLEHTAYIVCFGFLLTILLLGILWVIGESALLDVKMKSVPG